MTSGVYTAGLIALLGFALFAAALLWRRTMALRVTYLCTGAALLRLSCSLDPYLHPWDERYHALVGKNGVEAPLVPRLYVDEALPHDNTDWTTSWVWLHKPPLATWAISSSLALFGNEVWAVRLPSLLFGVIGTYLCFLLASSVVCDRIGLWAGALWAVNGHLIELASGRTSTDHIDALLVPMVLAGAVAALRMAKTNSTWWAFATGVAMGLGFLTKAWPALTVFLLAAVVLYSVSSISKARSAGLLAMVVGVAILIAGPWQIYMSMRFPELVALEAKANWAHLAENVEDHARPWYYYLAQFPMIHGEAAPIAVIAGLWLLWRKRDQHTLFLSVWFVVPFALFSLAKSKMPAYTAIAAPSIFVLIAIAADDWWKRYRTGTSRKWFVLVGVVLLVVLPLRFSWNRVKPFEEPECRYAITEELKHLGPHDVVIGFQDPIALMFHTNVGAAYEQLPDSTIASVRSKGYRVLRFSNGALEVQ